MSTIKSVVLLPPDLLDENLFVEMAHQALVKYVQESAKPVPEREQGMFLIGWEWRGRARQG